MGKKNRKGAEEYILKWIKKISGTDFNVNLYKDLFKSMTDKEFDHLMTSVREDGKILQLIVPPDKGATKISTGNNIKLLKELKHDFFQHLYIGPTDKDPKIKTKYKFFTYLAPLRRTKQTIEKGISVSENDKKIDILTGQVTGDSKSSKISYPEIQLLMSMGLPSATAELVQYRGGDQGSMRVIKQAILKYGKVNSTLLKEYGTGTQSSKTLKAYFNGMHYKINLG